MDLKENIFGDFKTALKEGNEIKKSALRMLMAEITRTEIEKRKKDTGLTEEEIGQVVARAVKMRKEAAESFAEAGRNDLAEKERAEFEILSQYLPLQMSDEDLRAIIEKVIEEISAHGPDDIGKVMSAVMGQVKGQADGSRVLAMAQELLS